MLSDIAATLQRALGQLDALGADIAAAHVSQALNEIEKLAAAAEIASGKENSEPEALSRE